MRLISHRASYVYMNHPSGVTALITQVPSELPSPGGSLLTWRDNEATYLL